MCATTDVMDSADTYSTCYYNLEVLIYCSLFTPCSELSFLKVQHLQLSTTLW